MAYIAAKNVVSPKSSWKMIRVLHDPGPATDTVGKTSWAVGFWDGRPVIVSRWNGSDKYPIGSPQSRGLPIWHVQEDASYEHLVPYLKKLAPQHAGFLDGFLALKAA